MATDRKSPEYLSKKFQGKRVLLELKGDYVFGVVDYVLYGLVGGYTEDGVPFCVSSKKVQKVPLEEE